MFAIVVLIHDNKYLPALGALTVVLDTNDKSIILLANALYLWQC